MIAIDVTMVQTNGDPFGESELREILSTNYTELIEFFNSCVDDGLVLNTVIPYPGIDSQDQPFITRYYAINTTKATEFQERFMSDTAPFSMKQFWAANDYTIQSITQTQIVFEDEPAYQLVDLVNVSTDLLWGTPMTM
jgi:hypothetical protein